MRDFVPIRKKIAWIFAILLDQLIYVKENNYSSIFLVSEKKIAEQTNPKEHSLPKLN